MAVTFSSSSGTPGGSNTQIQFNDSGVFGGDAGLTFTKGTGLLAATKLALGGATIGSNALAVTGTANFSGTITTGGSVINSAGSGLFASGGTAFLYAAGGQIFSVTGSAVTIVNTGVPLVFGNGTKLLDDAANTLAQRNGASAQVFNIYGTYTDASNYRRFQIAGFGGSSGGDYDLQTSGSGTGAAAGNLYFGVAGTRQIGFNGTLAALGPNAAFTSSFPALKRSTTILQARLADDSAFAPLQGSLRTAANAVTGLTPGALAALTSATIVITDASGQDYRVPCVI